MAASIFGSGFDLTLANLPAGPFSTADFVVEYRKAHAEEWSELEAKYGFGGKGAGQHYTIFTRVAHHLRKLAKAGEIGKLDYRAAPEWWGNGVVQFWSKGGRTESVLNQSENLDGEFREGSLKLRIHLRKERAWGLAKKKKLAFKGQHGRLFCERCGLEPVKVYGEKIGEAVIEVHHSQVSVGQMGEGQKTKLGDLQCLCANCHRLTHAELN